jgi:hypothetical protein
MKLQDVFTAIKDEGLDGDRLESYHTQLSALCSEMYLEMAQIQKEQAIYLAESEEKTTAGAERKWFALPKGQRQIELKNYIRATEKQLSSLKNRLYARYD